MAVNTSTTRVAQIPAMSLSVGDVLKDPNRPDVYLGVADSVPYLDGTWVVLHLRDGENVTVKRWSRTKRVLIEISRRTG